MMLLVVKTHIHTQYQTTHDRKLYIDCLYLQSHGFLIIESFKSLSIFTKISTSCFSVILNFKIDTLEEKEDEKALKDRKGS